MSYVMVDEERDRDTEVARDSQTGVLINYGIECNKIWAEVIRVTDMLNPQGQAAPKDVGSSGFAGSMNTSDWTG
jgi:hypothetical protein